MSPAPQPHTTNVVVMPPKATSNPYIPIGTGLPSENMPVVPSAIQPEGYRFYHSIIDPKLIYIEIMTMLLYDSQLVKSDTIDSESPIPGYKLYERKGGKKAMTYEGYKTVMGLVLLGSSIAISTGKTDSSYKSDTEVINETLSILRMIVAKRREWKFSNFALLRPVGIAIWKNLYHIGTRSKPTGGRAIINAILNPAMFFERGSDIQDEHKRFKLF